MIEVFKTDVQEVAWAEILILKLLEHFPQSKISFDLEDCDRILRIEGQGICCKITSELLKAHGYDCEVLQ